MSRLTLRLPETLHQQLTNLAEEEGISLNQYIVYALTRQVASAYTVQVISEASRQQQQQNFDNLVAQLGKADENEIEKVLSQRKVVQVEPELTPDIVNRLKTLIQNQNYKK
ncbi:MAG: toxin-antitoxin system HicB family antitoxin [Xenococcus sp. MO_188.B8]|nr:toxin-antitoxin system HicB family antitoxin [Xenococcus sp. MO_188.B8]